MEGRGSATITDITIDLVVNRDSYEEIYPSESDDSDSHDDHLSDTESENEAMKIFLKEAETIQNMIKEASEEQASASSRLNILDSYGQSSGTDPVGLNTGFGQSFDTRPDNLKACLATYKEERRLIFQDYAASMAKMKTLGDEQSKLKKKNRHVQKTAEKNRKKVKKAKIRESIKKQLARQEKAQAKSRLKKERVYFWPKKVYRVVLSLDTNFDMTPSSSRRDSIDIVANAAQPSSPDADSISIAKRLSIAQDSCQIGLAISYITQSAWWSPRYDLSLTTTTGSGMITYRAEFCNKTSESWRDAKIILSTSQTAFQDLGEAIPHMEPWRIGLARGIGQSNVDEALLSRSEMQHNHNEEVSQLNKFQEPRSALFGLANDSNSNKVLLNAWLELNKTAKASSQTEQFSQRPQPTGFGSLQVSAGSSALFGTQNVQQTPIFRNAPQNALLDQAQQTTLFSSAMPAADSSSQQRQRTRSFRPAIPSYADEKKEFDSNGYRLDASEDESSNELDTQTIIPQDPTIEFEESTWEETGLTATYDVPGIRTISPSQTTRRHKIASIALKNAQLSYVIVPKLREAAFLKARLCNNSSIGLLKGPVGLTLDGSFLGNSTIPRCSAGTAFSLNLGVDPGIIVKYQKPSVRRNQVGVFQKEGSCIFTRRLVMTNTKGNSVLEGVVLDQVPVSEDEKLKIEVLQPRGLRSEGDKVMSGAAVYGEAVKNGSSIGSVISADRTRGVLGTEDTWGRAEATLKNAGEICWNVKLNPGQRVRLDLEYEARFPNTEKIIGK